MPMRSSRTHPDSLLSRHRELGHRVGVTPAHLHVQRTAEELGALPGSRHGRLDIGGPVDGAADADLKGLVLEAQIRPRCGTSGWSARTFTRCSTMRYAESSTAAVSERGSPTTVSRESAPVCRANNPSRCATVGAGASATSPTRRRPTISRMPSSVARLSLSIDSKSAFALLGSRSWPDSAAVVSWPSRSCSSPSSWLREPGAVAGELERDPFVTQLPELDRPSLELCAQGSAMADRAPEGEDDQHDR